MIRDAVVHLTGEQPLVADLPALPTANDSCLICTNLRTLDGRRPVYTDAIDSTFVIPLLHVRFIEIANRHEGQAEGQAALTAGDEAEELDEDFLRRIREA